MSDGPAAQLGHLSLQTDGVGAVVLVADPAGARRLARALIALADAGAGDLHWMSQDWGGEELAVDVAGDAAVHHLKIVVGG